MQPGCPRKSNDHVRVFAIVAIAVFIHTYYPQGPILAKVQKFLVLTNVTEI